MTETDSVFEYRVAQIEELGFSNEDAAKLAKAKKLVANTEASGKTYFYEVEISWHDVRDLIAKGAAPEQVLAILL